MGTKGPYILLLSWTALLTKLLGVEGAGPTVQLLSGTRSLVLSPSTEAHREGVVRTDREEWRHTWVKFDYPDSG